MDTKRAHLQISGRVQGVNFRAATQQQARSAGVSGWVRNRDDGQVEALFEGPEAAVQQMISWCHHGPQYARVTHVAVEWQPPTDQEQGFLVR